MFRLQKSGEQHTRSVYGFLAFISDLGGVTEIVMLLFGFFLYPIAEFEFNLEALKHFFLARTSDNEMMEHQCKSFTKEPAFKIAKDKRKEIRLHKQIHLRVSDMVKLYIARLLGRCFPTCCWKKKDKFIKLYEEGEQRIQELFDLTRLVKTIRINKILIE